MSPISKRDVLITVAVGALLGVTFFWADSQLSQKIGRVEIGIAFTSPNLSSDENSVAGTTLVSASTVNDTTPSEIADIPVASIDTSSTSTTTTTTTSTTIALPNDVDETWRDKVLFLTNTARLKEGLEPLLDCGNLHRAAQDHAKAMNDQDFFEHDNPYTGSGPSDRSVQAGYQSGAGENIAMGYQTPGEVVRGWMNSSGHRENILGNYRDIGIGIFRGGSDRYGEGDWFYWVQNFGSSGKCS